MKFFAFLLTAVIAAPFDNAKWVNSRYTSRVAVHESCNSVQRIQLEKALDDYERLVHNANDYLLRSGPEDELAIKYFGTDSQAQNQVVAAGIYDNLSRGDKYGATLRCDDPDSLCAQIPTYAGHHRGTNGTLETVICDLSYETRKPIEQVCALGHRVPDDNASKFWGIDFIHRFSHLPIVAGGNVGHTADDFDSLIDLAKNNASASAWNMKTLQYYALDAWAHTFANPGVGCDEEEASQPAPAQPSPTADAPVSCHTHANGQEHCSSEG